MLSAVEHSDTYVQLQTSAVSDAQLLAQNDIIEEIRTTIISHPYLDDKLKALKETMVPWSVSI